MPPPAEIRALTGLRALPALIVVFFHFYRAHMPAIVVVTDVLDRGFVAVGMFFTLSGFILTYVYDGADLSDPRRRRAFFVARIARVYPVYLLSLAIGFAARFPRSVHDLGTTLGLVHLALVLPLLNSLSHYGMFHLNWAAWSLSVEAVFYVFFPWTLPRVRRLRDGALVALGVLAWLLGLVAPTAYTLVDPDHLGRPLRLGDEVLWSWYLKFFPLTHAACFLAGVVAGRLFVRHRDALGAVSPRTRDVLAGLLVLFVVAVLASKLVPYAYLSADVLAPVFALFVAVLAVEGSLASRVLASGPFVALGRASYAVYILHVPVFYVFLRFVPDMWDQAPLFWPYLAAVLLASVAAYRLVEEPCRRFISTSLAFRRGRAS
jgi:peptidoglycan/LPS O-acetylase OafA/YrhL